MAGTGTINRTAGSPCRCGCEEWSTMHSLYRLTAICFGVGVTLHNLEEAAYLPVWFRTNLKLPFEPNRKIYWLLTSLVSAVIWIPIVGVCVWPEDRAVQTVLSGFALLMVINVVVPHLALTLIKRSYSPGTGTAILLNLPLGVLLIREQLSAAAGAHAQIWRRASLYALGLAVGTLGCLYGAHAILAARKR
ncbi:HXXEE domain-containing protein [Acidobacteria bacterium AB60]|nr:HXXEE domain-containing protein [Acidobacteria bacterium AB60]